MHESRQMRGDTDGDIMELRPIPSFDQIVRPDTAHDRSDPGSSGYTGIRTAEGSQLTLGSSNGVSVRGDESPETDSLRDYGIRRIYSTTSRSQGAAGNSVREANRRSINWPSGLGKNRFSREVPWHGVRDHLALERTFLGWLRTSGAFAMTGVLLAQIAVIVYKNEETAIQAGFGSTKVQGSPSAMPPIHKAARPLAALTVGIALVTISIGVIRFYVGQKRLIEGYGVSGGWPIIGLAIVVLGYLLVVFLLTVLSSDP